MPFNTGTLKSFKVLFGAGKSAFVFLLALLALIIPLTNHINLPVYVTILVLFVALILPVFYVPLVYNTINNSPIVVFGRYHLPLFFSSVVGSIFVAVLFNISPSSALGIKIVLFFFSSVFIVFSILMYAYCYSSINVRINEGFKKLFDSAQNAFLFLAMTAFCLCFLYFYNDGVGTAYGIIGYVAASIMIIGGLTAYLASYRMIPKLVRVTLNPKRGVKESFLKFYSPLAVSDNHRTLISFFLFCVTMIIILLSTFNVVSLFELSSLYITLMLLFFSFSYCIGITLFSRKIYIGSFFVAQLAVISAITLVVTRTFVDFYYFDNAAVLIAMSLLGLAAGLIQNGFTSDFSDVTKRSNSTVGTVLNIKNTIASVSFFVAICLYYLFSLFNAYAIVVRFSFCAVTIILSFCVKFVKKKYLTLQFPQENEAENDEEQAETELQTTQD